MKRFSLPGHRSAALWVTLVIVMAAAAARLDAATPAPKKTTSPAVSAAEKPRLPKKRRPVRVDAGDRAILTDKDVLARVGDRRITVFDFRERYYASFHLYRPAADSAGRVQFLNSLVEKEILGLTALRIGKPLDFNDRATLRELTNTALANAFFDRTIGDSVKVSDEEILAVYDQYQWETHFRHILFADRKTATAVRADLAANRITWSDAVKKYSRAVDDVGPDGDMGWIRRAVVKGDFAIQIFDLKMGEISVPVVNKDGVHLVQAVERTRREPLALVGLQDLIRTQIRGQRTEKRLREVHAQIVRDAKITYDTTNIRWVSDQYWKAKKVIATMPDGSERPDPIAAMGGPELERILVQSPDRKLTLGEFFESYRRLSPIARTPLYSFESLHFLVSNLFLQPELVKLAVARGLEKDPNVVLLVERKREQLMVERMFQDSVLARMSIQPEQRRKHYRENLTQFVSNPKVDYAEYVVANQAAAEALVAKLAGGADARALAQPDQALGIVDAQIRVAYQEAGKPYEALLFDELKPGKSSQQGPDSKGQFKVTHEIAYHPQRQLAYEEVETIVDESVQNIEAERQLKALIARHRGAFEIESHPEWVMQFELADPILDARDGRTATD